MGPLIIDTVIDLPRGDRRKQHQFLSEMFLTAGQDRDFVWLKARDNYNKEFALVRKNDAVVAPIHHNDTIEFSVELFPCFKRNGKRVFITDEDQRTDFIIRCMSEHAGVVVEPFSIQMEELRDRYERDNLRIPFKTVIYQGRGQVVDLFKFVTAMKNGIHARKAYGCGMILANKI